MMNHLINLSEHFSLAELCKTKTGIENVPNEEQVENLKRVCGWLEQLRRRWNGLYEASVRLAGTTEKTLEQPLWRRG